MDAAAAFGARQDITDLTLSPDGNNVAFVVPVDRAGTAVKTLSLAAGAKPKVALYASGKPDRILGCNWVSNDRLVCQIYWIGPHPDLVPVLMFHGTEDINVRIQQSQMIDRALAAAGVKHQLIILEGLDHHLDDSIARTDMLRRSDAFLRDSFAQNSASTH